MSGKQAKLERKIEEGVKKQNEVELTMLKESLKIPPDADLIYESTFYFFVRPGNKQMIPVLTNIPRDINQALDIIKLMIEIIFKQLMAGAVAGNYNSKLEFDPSRIMRVNPEQAKKILGLHQKNA